MEAYKVKTFDFLPKPLSIEKLEDTFIRLFNDLQIGVKNYICINNRVFINPNEVYFIQKDNMRIVICTKNKTYTSYTSFAKIESSLPPNFIRCHKSYIVNVSNIVNIDIKNNIIVFEDNIQCFIGPKYKNSLLEVFYNGIFKRTNNTKSGVN